MCGCARKCAKRRKPGIPVRSLSVVRSWTFLFLEAVTSTLLFSIIDLISLIPFFFQIASRLTAFPYRNSN